MRKNIVVGALAAAALAVPTAALATPGNGHGQGKGLEKASQKTESHGQKAKSHKQKAPKSVQFVFKGVYKGAGVVTIAKGNHHAKKAGFVGQDVTFDLSNAKLVVADTDGAPGITESDVQAGDKVVVQARLPRSTEAPSTTDAQESDVTALVARKLIDQTHPAVKDDASKTKSETDGDSETETEGAPAA
jgi:hypothetical protein